MDQLSSGLIFNSTDTVFPLATVSLLEREWGNLSYTALNTLLARFPVNSVESSELDHLLKFVDCKDIDGMPTLIADGDFRLLLMGWDIDSLEPGDIEYLLNFVSCWAVNGISNLFYLTHADHDSGFELIISIENSALDSTESFITEVTLIEMGDGCRIRVTSDYPDAWTIENLIDSVVEWLGN